MPRSHVVTLGLRENAAQFALLILANAFVGATLGAERSLLPLLARDAFGIASATATLGFLVTFGLTKAAANYAAGRLADRAGRRRILLTGWLFALPVPLLLYWAPSWSWVVAANALLGVHQGLAWSATVIMKIELVGPRRRGLAMGLNEFAGYVAVALAALAGAYLAVTTGPRLALFALGLGPAVAGLLLTLLFVRDTMAHVALEHELAEQDAAQVAPARVPEGSGRAGPRRQLFAAYQAGLVNNLNDGVAWGLLPLYFAVGGLTVREIGWLAALYPAVWGVALAVTALGEGFVTWAVAAILLGLGTAAVYPTLIAQVSDLVRARERARAVGAYRLWRDLGYVAGALLAGAAADRVGFRITILIVAVITASSGLLAAVLLRPHLSTARRDAARA